MKTKEQLYNERIEFLKKLKAELKQQNLKQPHKVKENFRIFKQNCRDRKHDALAGYIENKTTKLFRWYSE